jgi:4-methyl-5(b-hydroxyethyl)-thiazole monophosphate biosynthesis
MVYVLLADGFEEMEAIAPIDVLTNAGFDVKLIGVDSEYVKGNIGVQIKTDLLLEDITTDDLEALILPGGYIGVENLEKNEKVHKLINYCMKNKILIGAICAAPTLLGKMGILEGKPACCYPGLEKELKGAILGESSVCVSDNIVTANGPAAALDFALKLLECLCGSEKSKEAKKAINYKNCSC